MVWKGSPILAYILGKCHLPHLEKAPPWKEGGKKGPLPLTYSHPSAHVARLCEWPGAGGSWVGLEAVLRKQQKQQTDHHQDFIK